MVKIVALVFLFAVLSINTLAIVELMTKQTARFLVLNGTVNCGYWILKRNKDESD